MFVKDSGADVTLIREDLVDSRNVVEGQNMTLYTAIGQPFNAKMAIVKIDSLLFKGYKRVGVVPNLAAESLLGMDVLDVQHVNVVTRAQSRDRDKVSGDEKPEVDARDEDIRLCVNAENLGKLQLSNELLSGVRDKELPSREAAEDSGLNSEHFVH